MLIFVIFALIILYVPSLIIAYLKGFIAGGKNDEDEDEVDYSVFVKKPKPKHLKRIK